MRIIGNLLWWLFGGLEAAIGYFHRKSGSCMYHHRHSLCDTDIQDWSALPMAFWCYSKRNE